MMINRPDIEFTFSASRARSELVMYDDLDHIDEHVDHHSGSAADDDILIDDESDASDALHPLVTEASTTSDTDNGDEIFEHISSTVNSIILQPMPQQQKSLPLPPLTLIKREAEFILPSTVEAKRIDPTVETSAAEVKSLDAPLGNEEQFLLSFAPNLTRLSARQNAFARLRILEELYKLEFE